jgi:phenylacetate-coenzyme A ligase PaaK-like adenylate-forming protein
VNLLNAAGFALWGLRQNRVTRVAPERVLALQQSRLRKLLRRVGERSPFYRKKYQGLDLGRCPLTDLPPVTKAELTDHLDEVMTDRRITRQALDQFMADPENARRKFLGKYVVCRTSGSQGAPLVVIHNALSLEVMYALQMTRGRVKRASVIEGIRRLFDPARVAGVGLREPFNSTTASWDHTPAAGRAFVNVLRLRPTDPDAVEQLNHFRPEVLVGYVSFLDMLALKKDQLRLAPGLRQVVSASEVLTDQARAAFQQAFRVPVLNYYSLAECIFLSNGCPTDPGAHVNADWVILEVVDEQNRPVPPGQPGQKVLVTNLANDVQPFIRYEVGDRVTMATTPCGCGSRLPRIAGIDGRTADYFWVRTGETYRQLLSFVFKTAFEAVPGVREWQVIQEDRNRIRVRLEPLPGAGPDPSRCRELLRRLLESQGLGDVEAEVEVVPRLGFDPATGKLRRIISRVGPPADLEQVLGGAPKALEVSSAGG